MARTIPSSLTTTVATKMGTKPYILVKIWWDYSNPNPWLYADRDVKDAQGSVFIPGKIVRISNINMFMKVTRPETVSNINLTLSDTDGEIKSIMDTVNIHKRYCAIYQAFEDVAITNSGDIDSKAILLTDGFISTPIIWDEDNRTVTFSIITKIEDKQVGLSIEQTTIENPTDSSISKMWPICFGTPKKVPAVRIKQHVTRALDEYVIPTYEDFERYTKLYGHYQKLWTKKQNYEENNRTNTDSYLDLLDEITKTRSKLYELYSQLRIEDEDTFTTFVTASGNYEETKQEYTVLKARLAQKRLELRNLWDELSAAMIEHYTNERLTEIQDQITDLNTEITEMEDELTEIMTNLATYMQEKWETLIELTKFGLTELRVEDPDQLPTSFFNLNVNDLVLRGYISGDTFHVLQILPTYTDLNCRSPEGDEPAAEGNILYINDNYDLVDHYLLLLTSDGEYHLTKVVKQNGEQCYITPSIWSEDGEMLNLSDATIKETSPLILDTWLSHIDTSKPDYVTGLHRLPSQSWAINIGDEVFEHGIYSDIYIFNHAPLAAGHPTSSIKEVTAYRTVDGVRRLVPIPSRYYDVYLNYALDEVYVSFIAFKRPLTSKYSENWEEDIYITVESALPDEITDVIAWLIQYYSRIQYDALTFANVRAYTQNYPVNFAILSRENILQLIGKFAFDSRIALYIRNNILYMKYLARSGLPVLTLDESQLANLKVYYSTTEDLATELYAKWRTDYASPEKQLVYRNNQPIFGQQTRKIDIDIYDYKPLVERTATFWLIRWSNSWIKVTFTAFLDTLELEPFDLVQIKLNENWITNDTDGGKYSVIGIVEEIRYDTTRYQLEYTVWCPIFSGTKTQYPLAWPGEVSADYPYVGFDNYPGGQSDGYKVRSGLSDFNIAWDTRPNDYGKQNNQDASETVPVVTATEKDYDIVKKTTIDLEDIQLNLTRLELERTVLTDDSGLRAKLSDLFSLFFGKPNEGQYEGGVKSLDTEDRAYIVINTDHLLFKSIYNDKDDQDLEKEVIAPFDIEYDQGHRKFVPKVDIFPAKITGYTEISTHRWLYIFQEVEIGNGFNVTIKTNGRQGVAYNLVETFNTGDGIEGNSIDYSNEIAGFDMVPVQGNPVVLMYRIPYSNIGQSVYAFAYVNSDDGSCQ